VPFDLDGLWGLSIAVLGGMAVGIEREWSGKSSGPAARFAGLRTFTMLGLTSGLAGWFWTAGFEGPSIILLAGLSALVVVAYLAASRADVDGTTEVAAFVVMAAGILAGTEHTRVASGIIAVTTLLLVEKKQLHGLVSKLDREEVQAGVRFAVMAAVVLPLLPNERYGPLGGVQPRLLWALVLFFSGLSFLGYIAQRAVGPRHGYAIAGVLGGLVSSTSVTFTFARLSRTGSAPDAALAAGTLGANVMLFPRVLVAASILAPGVTLALWPAFVAPALLGLLLVLRNLRGAGRPDPMSSAKNPLQFWAAIQMTVVFQIVLYAVAFAESQFGRPGLYSSAAVLGLVDMDALTISMARMASEGTPAAIAAIGVAVGVLSNTAIKLGITLVIGRGAYRARAGLGLLGLGVLVAGWLIGMARG